MPNLSELLKYLLQHDLDFIVIGGYAGIAHGSSLVTKDLDVCALLSPESITKFREALAPLNPKHRMTPKKLSFLTEPRSIQAINNLYLETDLGILDILTEVKGIGSFEELKKRATKIPLFGLTCNVISIDDLITAKKALGREKDKIAVRELEIIKTKKSTT